MATRADIPENMHRRPLSTTGRPRSDLLSPAEWLTIGWGAGLLGGVVMALPLIFWDWVHSAHVALELPMATTAWLFGLERFSHETYLVWPIVVGLTFLGLYCVASGLAFAGLADRVYALATLGTSLVAGAAWGFINFIFFWYMVLPIARDGAPFRATAAAPALFVAPDWVWIVAFTAFGLATGLFYAVLRGTAPGAEAVGGVR